MNLSPKLAKMQTLSKLGYSDEYTLDISHDLPRLQDTMAQFISIPDLTPVPSPLCGEGLGVRCNRIAPENKTCIRRTALGDLLMLFLSLEEYVRVTGEKIVLATSKSFFDLCQRQKFIDEVCDFSELGGRRFTKIFDLEGAVDFSEHQIARQQMFARLLGVTLTTHPCPSGGGEGRRGCNTPFHIKKSPNYIRLYSREKKWASNILSGRKHPLIGVMPKSKSYLRDWGRELELIDSCPFWTFLIFHHQPLPEFDGIRNVVNFAGKTTVMEMCALASQTDCGGFTDTGLMHVYGNLGKPYVLVSGGVIPPELRIAYYDRIYPLVSKASCSCPRIPCFDGLRYDCRGTKHFKICMDENVIPLRLVIARLRQGISEFGIRFGGEK
jgi:hypothetical protein